MVHVERRVDVQQGMQQRKKMPMRTRGTAMPSRNHWNRLESSSKSNQQGYSSQGPMRAKPQVGGETAPKMESTSRPGYTAVPHREASTKNCHNNDTGLVVVSNL